MRMYLGAANLGAALIMDEKYSIEGREVYSEWKTIAPGIAPKFEKFFRRATKKRVRHPNRKIRQRRVANLER